MRKILISIICLLMITGCESKKDKMKSFIEGNFQIIQKSNVISKNPFDYVRNEGYQNILDLGTEALDLLQQSLTRLNNDGIVSAVAMQDIVNIDITKITGKEWSDGKQFKELWDEAMNKMIVEIEGALDNPDKLKEVVDKYGVLGEAIIYKIYENGYVEMINDGTNINREYVEDFTFETSKEELETAYNYLKTVIK